MRPRSTQVAETSAHAPPIAHGSALPLAGSSRAKVRSNFVCGVFKVRRARLSGHVGRGAAQWQAANVSPWQRAWRDECRRHERAPKNVVR
jgi:hypothetical protein